VALRDTTSAATSPVSQFVIRDILGLFDIQLPDIDPHRSKARCRSDGGLAFLQADRSSGLNQQLRFLDEGKGVTVAAYFDAAVAICRPRLPFAETAFWQQAIAGLDSAKRTSNRPKKTLILVRLYRQDGQGSYFVLRILPVFD
jgi:hypothetical protein